MATEGSITTIWANLSSASAAKRRGPAAVNFVKAAFSNQRSKKTKAEKKFAPAKAEGGPDNSGSSRAGGFNKVEASSSASSG